MDRQRKWVLRNAWIIDGTGASGYSGDILVEAGKILAVGDVGFVDAEEIDAAGAVAAPGFIDVHTHYDAQALWDPMLSPSSIHGITTALCGNCGFTLAPLSDRPQDVDYLLRMLARVEGMSLEALKAGVIPDWRSFGEYLHRLEGGLAINAGFLVGHSALRVAVMGDRAVSDMATEDEVEQMVGLLRSSIADGGLGFSTTISPGHMDMEGRPVPSRWASREELLSLCAVVGDYPGTWLEMVPGAVELTESHYAVMTDMALAGRRPLNWNVYFVSSEKQDGFLSQLRATDYAAERGAVVFGLIQAGPSKLRINLQTGQLLDGLPVWPEFLSASHSDKLKALADPVMRSRLAEAPRSAGSSGAKWIFRDWGLVTIEEAFLPEHKRFEQRTLRDIGEELGKEPLEALFDIALLEDLQTSFAPPTPGNDEMAWNMRASAWRDEERCVMGGSDAGAHLDMSDAFTLPTRLLGECVRERKLISLEDAIRLLTSAPADRFGLKDRGRLVVGAKADMVIFDPETVAVGAVETRTDLPASGMRLYADAIGIRKVIVNGEVILQDGMPTGARPGQILRSGIDTQTVDGRPAARRDATIKT